MVIATNTEKETMNLNEHKKVYLEGLFRRKKENRKMT